jgi:hypothetical protein
LVAVDAVAITQAHMELLVVVLVAVLVGSIKAQFICHQQLHVRLVLHNPVLRLLAIEVLLLVLHHQQVVSLVETMHRTVTQFSLLVVVECFRTRVVVQQCLAVFMVTTVAVAAVLVAVAVVVVAQVR